MIGEDSLLKILTSNLFVDSVVAFYAVTRDLVNPEQLLLSVEVLGNFFVYCTCGF